MVGPLKLGIWWGRRYNSASAMRDISGLSRRVKRINMQ